MSSDKKAPKENRRKIAELFSLVETLRGDWVINAEALMEIKERLLYKEFTSSFRDFVKQHTKYKDPSTAYKFIKAIKIRDALKERGFEVLPHSESQYRPLSKFFDSDDDFIYPELYETWDEIVGYHEQNSINMTAETIRQLVDKEPSKSSPLSKEAQAEVDRLKEVIQTLEVENQMLKEKMEKISLIAQV